jgi:hypothetical protein
MLTQMSQQERDQQESVSYSPTLAVAMVPLLEARSNHHLLPVQLCSPIPGEAPDLHHPHPNHHLHQNGLHITTEQLAVWRET